MSERVKEMKNDDYIEVRQKIHKKQQLANRLSKTLSHIHLHTERYTV